jgi:carbohydrate kinase (thermoresistant glucokinase family)
MSRKSPICETVAQSHPKAILVLMGVSGCGKSTIAAQLAEMLGWPMEEGDRLHPAANIEKMRRGLPLNDEDRQPWLRAIAATIDGWRRIGSAGIITCSALKRIYRDQLTRGRPEVWFIFLQGDKDLIRARLAGRSGHFMPPDLLDSQFADLEKPASDERVITVDIARDPVSIAKSVIDDLHLKLAAAQKAILPAQD